MKMGEMLLVYSFTMASVIPSPIMNCAFNLLAFGIVILLVLTLFIAIASEDTIESTLTKAKDKDPLIKREAFRKGKKKFLFTFTPVMIVLVACGHWIIGSCLFIAGVILLELLYQD